MNDCSRRGREGNTAVHNIFAHIRWSKGLRGHRHYWCTVSSKSPINAQQPEPLSRTSGNYEQKSNLRSLTGNPESELGGRHATRPGPPGRSSHSTHLPLESPSPLSLLAAQGRPEAKASLGWRLPSRPGLPEAQLAALPPPVAFRCPIVVRGPILLQIRDLEAQGAGLRVAGVADWASSTLSSRRQWRRELSVCAMAALEAFGRPGAPADSRPAPPRSKAKAGELAGCLLRHKAFRKPPRAQEAFGRPGAPADSQPAGAPGDGIIELCDPDCGRRIEGLAPNPKQGLNFVQIYKSFTGIRKL
ncbi:hypothetical protein QTO34_005159 [Cnephaeus nilssonii]|uniref:Uncharacterized protein n=1 Tax=Cnephaeus nilssonii TaxID=3371016 RepID=A0AA40HMX5_CNENI|nr:hypothetical protein QTO34_005159 [Eptesicus nilssonii]